MLHLLGMGYAHPTGRIPTEFLEKLDVGTTVDWIHRYIGIQERATSLPLEYIKKTQNQNPLGARKVRSLSSFDLGVDAARTAIKNAGIKPEQVGLLICNSCTPDQTIPGEGRRVASEIGIGGLSYDVFSACPSFALHVDYVNKMSEKSLPEYVLCLSTATFTQKVDYSDRSAGAIWGDGAAAWILSTKSLGKLRVVETFFDTDPSRSGAVVIDSHGHFRQDGRAVRDFSVRQTVRMLRRLEKEYKLDWDRDVFIGHQANRTMLQQICDNRKIPDSNHWHNVSSYGNQAGASAPIVLAMNWDRLVTGQRVVIAVVGAGLSWGSVLMEVA